MFRAAVASLTPAQEFFVPRNVWLQRCQCPHAEPLETSLEGEAKSQLKAENPHGIIGEWLAHGLEQALSPAQGLSD